MPSARLPFVATNSFVVAQLVKHMVAITRERGSVAGLHARLIAQLPAVLMNGIVRGTNKKARVPLVQQAIRRGEPFPKTQPARVL